MHKRGVKLHISTRQRKKIQTTLRQMTEEKYDFEEAKTRLIDNFQLLSSKEDGPSETSE